MTFRQARHGTKPMPCLLVIIVITALRITVIVVIAVMKNIYALKTIVVLILLLKTFISIFLSIDAMLLWYNKLQ